MSIVKVAKVAGVSSSTVSRVINNHPRVSPETADAVRKAMAELSYTPSDRRPGPKPLKRQATENAHVKFLALGSVRGSATPGFSELLSGISTAATQQRLRLSFSHVANAADLERQLHDEEIDGLLLHGSLPDGTSRPLLERYPTVWVMGNRSRPRWGDRVMPDAYAIGELAADFLHEHGHKSVAFLNLEACFWPFRLYEHAFLLTAAALKMRTDSISYERPTVTSYWQPHAHQAVSNLANQLLALESKPTAVFVADDMQVAQIQPVLQQRGVTIGRGKDLEVISCNNELPYLAGLNPRPTSIDIQLPALGRRALDQLHWRLRHRDVTERYCVTIEPRIAEPDDAENADGMNG